MNYNIRKLKDFETELALNLVWKVFKEYEAPDYSEEGIEEFYKSIHNKDYISMLSIPYYMVVCWWTYEI